MDSIDEDWEEWNPSKGKFIHHVIGGSVAGLVEHISIFPVDTVKTHMQCNRCPINGTQIQLSGLQTAVKLVNEEGPRRMFRGVNAMFGACIPAHAAYFSIFEACKFSFGADGPTHTPLAAGAAGVCATVAHDLIMTPMDVVKQRLQLGYYSGTMNCINTILAKEGLKSFYLSFPTTLFMNIPYGMVMVASNESLKLVLNPSGEHNAPAFFLSGALSGALAGGLTNPLDVAKTRLQTQRMFTACGKKTKACQEAPHLRLQYRGMVDALLQIKQQEGWRGLFRGVGPRLLVHTPSVAVSWTTYEIIKNILAQ